MLSYKLVWCWACPCQDCSVMPFYHCHCVSFFIFFKLIGSLIYNYCDIMDNRESDDVMKQNDQVSILAKHENSFMNELNGSDLGKLEWWQKYREFYTAPITKFWLNVVSNISNAIILSLDLLTS